MRCLHPSYLLNSAVFTILALVTTRVNAASLNENLLCVGGYRQYPRPRQREEGLRTAVVRLHGDTVWRGIITDLSWPGLTATAIWPCRPMRCP